MLKFQYLIIGLASLLLVNCNGGTSGENTPENYWPFDSDSANISIFLYDYPSFTLTNGYFQKFEKCTDCPPDSLPVQGFYRRPGSSDIGGLVGWIYNVTGDTLFKVNIGAWGYYSIEYPKHFFSPDTFTLLPDSAKESHDYKFFQSWAILTYPDSVEIDTVKIRIWDSIKYFDIMHDYDDEDYSVGILGFAPKVAVIVYR